MNFTGFLHILNLQLFVIFEYNFGYLPTTVLDYIHEIPSLDHAGHGKNKAYENLKRSRLRSGFRDFFSRKRNDVKRSTNSPGGVSRR
jgi:hypothetical protein